ncbi:MAG TPA: hypothetical protein VFZ34_14555 [Blastocatellia bacterium]|nr:hypothetical protein [Blastocatellia bacterium]
MPSTTQQDIRRNTAMAERWSYLSHPMTAEEYNFEHFRAKHFLADVKRTINEEGIRPGEIAPNFELPRAGGGSLRLSELRGRPVLLHFGSPT